MVSRFTISSDLFCRELALMMFDQNSISLRLFVNILAGYLYLSIGRLSDSNDAQCVLPSPQLIQRSFFSRACYV